MGNVYDEQSSNLASCQKSVTFSKQLDSITLYDDDMYIFLIFSSIGLLLNLGIIVMNSLFPMMRKRPGDLFCGLAVAESLLSAHWIISAANQMHSGDTSAVRSNEAFCTWNSFVSVTAGQLEFFYNLLIYTYVICAVRNMRIVKLVKPWYIHVGVGVSSVIFTLILYGWGALGKTLFGTCSLRSTNQFPLSGIGLLLMYIFFSFSTLLYLNYKLPRIAKYQELLGFYQKYMMACIAIWSLLVVCQIMVYLNCMFIHVPLVNVFITIGNVCKVATTIILPVVRISDPNVRLVFRQVRRKQSISYDKSKAVDTTHTNEQISSSMLNSSFSMDQGLKMNLVRRATNINKLTEKTQEVEMTRISRPKLNLFEEEELEDELESRHSISLEDIESDQSNLHKPRVKRTQSITSIDGKKQSAFNDDKDEVRFRRTISQSVRPSVELSVNFYENLSNNQRESILFRIISGILLSEKRKYKNFKIDITCVRGTSIFDQIKIFTLGDKLITSQLKGIPEKCLEIHRFEDIRMTSYCPLLFQSLIERDRVNISKSLDLIANRTVIKIAANESDEGIRNKDTNLLRYSKQPTNNMSEGNDQVTGEIPMRTPLRLNTFIQKKTKYQHERNHKVDDYFFYSSDKQLILKTISKKQLKIFLEMLKDYYNHIKLNPQSLLMRVYGIYEFKGIESSELVLILMKNVAPCPSAFIQRRYDLKGSTVQRQVLSEYPETSNDGRADISEEQDVKYRGMILKDIDFNQLEKNVDISQSDKEGLMQVLERDVLFLLRNGMMNYSLVVIKVDWDRYTKDYLPSTVQEKIKDGEFEFDKLEQEFIASSLKSVKQQGVYYMFGIIDFLHKFTIYKRMARYYKMMQYRTTDLDISSADPGMYSHRFLSYCKKIINIQEFPC